LSKAQLETHHLEWYGDYTLRVSTRAKHLRLVVNLREGLVVVMPARFDRARLPEVLESKRGWLLKLRGEMQEQASGTVEPALPERIELRAVGEEWSVEYRSTASPRVTVLARRDRRLIVSGQVADPEACREALRRWVSRRAHAHLVPWVATLASTNGFRPERVVIRAQKTLWGSCSFRRTLSLNRSALFLPPELAEYLLLHELCHTVHLNHSPKFWKLVSDHCADYPELRRRLRRAGGLVPAWAGGLAPICAPATPGHPRPTDGLTELP
jgi:hypothetical protein